MAATATETVQIDHADIMLALRAIADPSAREITRRKINREFASVMPRKITDAEVLTDQNHAGTSAWKGEKLKSLAPTLKSGPRKGWPKGGLPAEFIAALPLLKPVDGFQHAKPVEVTRKAAKTTRKTTRTVAAQESAARLKVSDSEMDAILSMESEDSLATTFRPVAA